MENSKQDRSVEENKEIHLRDYIQVVLKRKKIFIAVLLAVMGVGIFIAINLPNKYRSAVSIKVKPEYEEQSLSVYRQRYFNNTYWMANEFSLMKSDRVLQKVAKKLDLNNYLQAHPIKTFADNACNMVGVEKATIKNAVDKFWGLFTSDKPKETSNKLTEEQLERIKLQSAVGFLKSCISTAPHDKESTIVDIVVTTVERPQLASLISSTLVEVYSQDKIDLKLNELNKSLSVLKAQISDQAVDVANKRQVVRGIREKYKLPINSSSNLSNPREIDELRTALSQAKVQMLIDRKTYEQVEKMTTTELEEALGVIIEDSKNYSELKNRINEALLEFELLKIDFGNSHPKVVTSRKKMQELRKQLDERLAGLKSGLKLKYEKSLTKVNGLQTELDAILEMYSSKNAKKVEEFEMAKKEFTDAERVLDELKNALVQARVNMTLPRSGVLVTSVATLPYFAGPNTKRNLLIVAMLSVALATGMVFFLDYLDSTIKDSAQLEQVTGLDVLTVIPKGIKSLATSKKIVSGHLELYRILYTNLKFAMDYSENSTVVAFTSTREGEGKSTTCSNLGFAAATAGKKVVIIDADLHRPVQHKYSSAEGEIAEKGFVDLVTGDSPISDCIIKCENENVVLDHIHAGSNAANYLGLINPTTLGEVFNRLRDEYDLVLVDCPPVLGVNDSSLIANVADHAIFIVKEGGYSKKLISQAVSTLRRSDAKLAGVVYNHVKSSQFNYYTNYIK